MSADRGASLHVVLSAMADFGEMLRAAEYTATEPDGIALHHVLRYIDFDGLGRLASVLFIFCQSIIDSSLNALVQTFIKVLKESAAS